ncbi:unnamed protein product, partial [Iphiclides podalirius]
MSGAHANFGPTVRGGREAAVGRVTSRPIRHAGADVTRRPVAANNTVDWSLGPNESLSPVTESPHISADTVLRCRLPAPSASALRKERGSRRVP